MSKIKEVQYVSALLLLFCLSLSVIWLMINRIGQLKSSTGEAMQQIALLDRALLRVQSERGWCIATGSREVPMELSIETEDHSIVSLQEWLGDSMRLILFLSDQQCSSCIEQALFTLKTRLPVIGSENIRVIYTSESGHSNWKHRRLILPGTPFGRIVTDGYDGWFEEVAFPLFFVTGQTPTAASPHLFQPSEDADNEYYLDQIANLFPSTN